jgi:tripeptide aminopeptidase
MDTVTPATGIRVIRDKDTFRSGGDTVLGADDKSGIAILLEVMQSLVEEQVEISPVELVLTTCEEIGLLGAKYLNMELVDAKVGFALDSSGTDHVIIGAPAANKLRIEVTGLAAHAGLNPEKGISAIQLAAQAIGRLRLGKLDNESTANIGRISGGTATNIVPARVLIEGEVRSHSEEKLRRYTEAVQNGFEQTIAEWRDPLGQLSDRPTVTVEARREYPRLAVSRSHPLVQRIESAAARLGRSLEYITAGGGSDANIFAGHGRTTVILGTGMSKVHTTAEQITLDDMVRTAELVRAVIVCR